MGKRTGEGLVLVTVLISIIYYIMKKKITTKNLVTLTRTRETPHATNGVVKVFNKQFYTLELPDKDNQQNISSIPAGEYDVVYTWSPSFKKFTYEIMNVPKRSGIRIHPVNFVSGLRGCVGLGNGVADLNSDGIFDITDSVNAVNEFEKALNYQPFKLKIT